MLNMLRSAWTWLLTGLLVLIWLPLLAVIRLFDRDPVRYRTGRWFRRVGLMMTKVNPFWTIIHEGVYPENPRHPYVVVSNHQSLADIPVVSRLPWEMKWVGKVELFETPWTGWMMKLAGDIAVDRGDRASGAKALIAAKRYLEQRCSVIFFAEGTRSKDGRLNAFNDGAFRLAIKAGVPILPVVLDGTSDALPKHSWRFTPGEIRLTVLPPVSTDGLKAKDTAALREQVRGLMVNQIATWRGVPPATVDATAETSAPAPTE
ncbi:MAG: lysophospholipid acyltransferase family protein [Bacteroidota bacterium]